MKSYNSYLYVTSGLAAWLVYELRFSLAKNW